MKKLVASMSIASIGALGAFGLLGLGATAASAGPITTTVCTAVTSALTTSNQAVGVANNNEVAASGNLSGAVTAQASALAAYGTAFGTLVVDLDKTVPNPTVVATDRTAVSTTGTAFVNAFMSTQAGRTAEELTSAAVDSAALTQSFWAALATGAHCP